MRTEEIKETKVVGTKYIADDGTEFYSIEECEKYEKSALFVMKAKLKLIADTNEDEFSVGGCYDDAVEVFDVQTREDLDNLKAYLHLVLSIHGVRDFDNYFSKDSSFNFNFANVTFGHEVIIWWSYDQDHFWVYGNGSIDAYLDYVKQKALNTIDKYKVDKEKKEEKKEQTC